MRGIAGVVAGDGGPAERDMVRRTIETIRHLGPGCMGIHIDSELGFGGSGLSSIVPEGGHQLI